MKKYIVIEMFIISNFSLILLTTVRSTLFRTEQNYDEKK